MIVLQHEPLEGPGSLASLLPPGTRIVRAWEEPIPAEADALLVLGGGMSAYDDLPFLRDELALIRRSVDAGKPVLGICLGSQLLARALGGTVARAKQPELGFYRVKLLPDAASDRLFAGAPSSFVALHWHFDAFTLPPGAVPLAGSTLTPLQAFRYGDRAWGVQFHLEMDRALLEAFVESSPGDLNAAAVEVEALWAGADRELHRIETLGKALFTRWLSVPARES
ncbi:MAG TPA: type 1 glutamine amidotransferase [Myxococcales bacterium]|jgi:GMP synthase (glutamine-hydrolysing)